MPETDSFEKRIEDYFDALKRYSGDEMENPPSFATGKTDDSIEAIVYVEKRLAKKLVEEKLFFKKHFSALRYGYVGDKRGSNGIRDVHEKDGMVYEKATILLQGEKGHSIMKKYNMNPRTTAAIKVVAHDMSLRRLYGIMDKESMLAVLVGTERYR